MLYLPINPQEAECNSETEWSEIRRRRHEGKTKTRKKAQGLPHATLLHNPLLLEFPAGEQFLGTGAENKVFADS